MIYDTTRQCKTSSQFLRFCSQAIFVLALLMTSISAWGQAVIMNGNYFLTHNEAGNAVNSAVTSTFNPATCLWYINNRYIRTADSDGNSIGGNNNYLQASQSGLSLGSSSQWQQAEINQNLISQQTGWLRITYYYLRHDNTNWQISTTNTNVGRLYDATITPLGPTDNNTTAPAISIASVSGNTISFSRTDLSGTYVPQYTHYVFNSATHNWYNNTDYGNTVPSVNANTLSPTYTWSLTANGGGVASINSTTGVLTLNGAPTGNITVRLTVSNISPLGNKTVDFTLTRADVAQSTNTSTEVTTLTISPSSAALYYNESQAFTSSATAAYILTTTPAHTRLTGGGNTYYYYYNGSLYTNTDQFSTKTESPRTVTLRWSLSGDAASYLTRTPATGNTTTVTHSTQSTSDLTATLTVTAEATGAVSKTATATITAYGPTVAPTITRSGDKITLATTSIGATIYYTTDGTTPSTSSTEYTGPFDLTTSPTTVKAIAIREGHSSEVTTEEFKLQLPAPVIDINNTGLATITAGAGSPSGTTFHYTTDGTTPTASSPTYSSPVQLTNPQTIRAIATLEGYDNSEVTTDDFVTPGTSGDNVIIDDREDHSWSYYSDPQCPIRSLNPADVKITYYGNGQDANNMTTTDNANTPTTFGAKATGVQVSATESENTFIYLKTLERTNGEGAASKEAANGAAKYSTIPNPFQKRPTYGSAATTRTIYLITSGNNNGRGTLTVDYTNASGESARETVNINSNNFSNTRSITAKVGERITYTLTRTGGRVYSVGRYDTDNGPEIWNVNINSGTSTNSYTVTAEAGNNFRGFYAWRVKSKSASITSITDANGNAFANNIIPAETEIRINTTSEYGNEIEFEALWAQAYVTTGTGNLSTYVPATVTSAYERNFHVVTAATAATSYQQGYPHTVSARYPDGTSAGGSISAGFTAAADTKFEDISITGATGSTWTANGHDLIIGRGCTGTVQNLYGLNGNATASFKLRAESGTFTNLYFLGQSRNFTNDAVLTSILGCDYDRAKVEGGDATYNEKLRVTDDIALGVNGTTGNTNNKGAEVFNCTVKSGDFDLGSDNYGGNYQFYASSYGSGGTPYTYGKRTLVVEGGIFSDISGGMESDGVGTQNVLMFDLRIKGGTMNSPVYGAAQYSGAIGHRRFIITGGTFKSWIAGGANGTKTDGGALDGNSYIYFGGNAVCSSNNSSTTMGPGNATGGNIFGAGSGNASAGDNATVGQVTNSTIVIADKCEVERNVYGGGNYGYVSNGNANKSDIYFYGGTVNGSIHGGSNMQKGQNVNIYTKGTGTVKGGIYGGSNQRGVINYNVTINIDGGTMEGGVYGGGYGTNANSCDVTGTVDITMTGGTILTGLYGGGNVNSKINGKTTVNVNGGTVGASDARANVYGGGLGAATRAKGIVEVNIGSIDNNVTSGNAVIWGDVYGGSAKGVTNCNDAGTGLAADTKTDVTLNAGTINGSLYGGGHGIDDAAANVWGPVKVVVNGGSVRKPENNPGSVFGCNNAAGSPKNTVTVTVNKTDPTVVSGDNKTYAINGVYGGGNLAHYDYDNANYPTVTINGCETSIKDVYGGGNAAAVPSTHVTINGGDIDRVFGGGNGESGTPAHIGYKNNTDNSTSNPYDANGNVTLDINGGTINQVFGGSNAHGLIKGTIGIDITKSSTCPMHIGEVYGGGNEAAGNAGNITIGCTGNEGEGIRDLYGGARMAAVNNNIALNITGGSINRVFGGNNVSGTINGTIAVTVNWATTNPCGSYLHW